MPVKMVLNEDETLECWGRVGSTVAKAAARDTYKAKLKGMKKSGLSSRGALGFEEVCHNKRPQAWQARLVWGAAYVGRPASAFRPVQCQVCSKSR